VAHNASFDLGFVNAELGRASRAALGANRVVDTLALARRRHPAGPNTLDALCKRYGIDLSARTKHGALLDAMLLAGVYVELLGERQAALVFDGRRGPVSTIRTGPGKAVQRPAPLPSGLSAADETAHAEFVRSLGPNALWLQYANPDPTG
jgi:DNA polymerase-3 subunit epsilon